MSKPEDNLGDYAKKGSPSAGPFSDPEVARAASKKGHAMQKERKAEVEKILLEAGFEPGEAPETVRQLAVSAVKGTAADMRLFLQQTGQLTKGPVAEWDGMSNCPTCGLDPAGGLVITADDVRALGKAVRELERVAGGTELPLLPDATLVPGTPDVDDK